MRRRPQQKGAGHGGSRAEDEVFPEAVRQPTTSFNDLKPFLVGSRIPFSALPAAFQKQRTAPARHEALSLGAGGPLRTPPPGCITRGCPQGSSFAPSLATRSALKTSLLFVSTGLTSYHPGRSKVTCCVADVPWARLPSAPLQKHHKGPFPGLLAGSLRLTPFLPESPLHYSSFFPVSKSLSHPFKKAHTVHPTRANSRV